MSPGQGHQAVAKRSWATLPTPPPFRRRFPHVDWMGQPWVTLRQVTDPYLNLFRNLIPPLMGQARRSRVFVFC